VLWFALAAQLLVARTAGAEVAVDSEAAPAQPADSAPAPAPDGPSPADGRASVPATESTSAKPAADSTAPAPAPASASAKPAANSMAPAPASTVAAEKTPEKSAADSLPGSPANPGLGLSPQAPPTPPPPGGRAPSFGAPTDRDAWVFRWGGRISGYQQTGIGRQPQYGSSPTQSGTALHTPPLVVGKVPIWAGPGGTLSLQYGNQTLMAFASFEAAMASQEYQGYYRSDAGPRIRSAYLLFTPAPIGDLRLRFQFGAFPASYGAPGQWGWGLFGPVLSIRGYGGTATASYDLGPRTQVSLEYGIAAVPEVDQAFVRGTYADWPENGLSTIVNHAHAGISFENKYFAKLHLAQANGRDMRTWLDSAMPMTPHDGKIQVAALELRMAKDPYGELGVTPVYYGFDHALAVHNGFWWGMDWTAGGREMTRKFLGPQSGGTGKIVGISAEYDFSLMRIRKAPEPFDGNGPDLRVNLAFFPFWTVQSQDANYEGGKGYFLGATFEYVMLSWLSTTLLVFGENREMAMANVSAQWQHGRWASHSATVGVVLHSDWQSQDKLVLAYTRYFYTSFADNNPARPLDRDVITVGGSVAF
jgi:hypothetical protein